MVNTATKEAEVLVNKKVPDSYLILRLKYYELVLEYAAGLKVLNGLRKAEMLVNIEYGFDKIAPLGASEDFEISARVISAEDYKTMKLRHILGITKKPTDE